ncbi:citrate/2-methylcitrate synthase [Bacilliculturomica massiliensis]|uniref:citrate/2-methylcitrate synthase n=1 Tax=Bacilliculturomica massiliensis TaxID=1917867 RepID=UPI002ED20ABD
MKYIHHTHRETKDLEKVFIESMTDSLKEKNQIDNSLYGKYDYVKRGLRDANGAGVVVGLTKVGDVHGYRINEKHEKLPDEGRLYYRGINVAEIVENCLKNNRFGYEETSYLLLFGELPTEKQLDTYKQILGANRRLPDGFARDMILTMPSRNIMNKLSRTVLALYSYDPDPDNTEAGNVLRQSINLIAQFPSIIAYAYQAQQFSFHNESLYLHQPDPGMSTAETILRLLRPTGEYTELEARLLDISLIIHAEHGGGNNSTFTTHLISSTGTDTYAAISAAVGSLKGPKHGGANMAVPNMITDLKRHVADITDHGQVEDYLVKVLQGEVNDKSGIIYGLGHAVYTLSDPRTTLLKRMAQKLAEEQGKMDDFLLYDFIERRGPELFHEIKGTDKPMPANVDLYSAFVYSALNIPYEMATPIFATARISGWCAHRIEELAAHGKIMRPAYKSVQPPRSYTPMEERE